MPKSKGTSKKKYGSPSFAAVPIATMCSKSGCSPHVAAARVPSTRWSKERISILNSRPRLPKDIILRADEPRMFLFEPKVQQVFETNPTGARILVLADGKRTVAEIASQIGSEFHGAPSDIEREVAEYFLALQNAGLNIELR